MSDPNLSVTVAHSKSQNAWNITGTKPGKKYKIAIVPYLQVEDEMADTKLKSEALQHAEFIAYCFNNSKDIVK